MDIEKIAHNVSEKIDEKLIDKVVEKVIERIEEKLTERLVAKLNQNVEKTSTEKTDDKPTKVEFLDISSNFSALSSTPYSKYSKDTDIKKDGELLNIEKSSLDALNFNNQTFNGKWDISYNYNSFNNCAPRMKTSDFIIKDMQCYFLVDNKDGPTYITFPNASDWPHYWNRKEIIIKNLQEQPIFSSESNIRQLGSNEISNCILPAVKDKYVSLMTNGKHWYIKSIF
jgi:hypothetical protein